MKKMKKIFLSIALLTSAFFVNKVQATPIKLKAFMTFCGTIHTIEDTVSDKTMAAIFDYYEYMDCGD